MISWRTRSTQLAALCSALLMPIAANATGHVTVLQFDGSTQTYEHVRMKLVGLTLFVTSPNRKDVLEIVTDACSYPAGVEHCLAYRTTLRRGGRPHTIPLDRGGVYVNATSAAEHLPHSSQVLAPHHVIVDLHTVRGTYIAAFGTLDNS